MSGWVGQGGTEQGWTERVGRGGGCRLQKGPEEQSGEQVRTGGRGSRGEGTAEGRGEAGGSNRGGQSRGQEGQGRRRGRERKDRAGRSRAGGELWGSKGT